MAAREVLAAIYRHLAAAEERLGPGAHRTRVAIRRARVRVEGLLGESFPPEKDPPRGRPWCTWRKPTRSPADTSGT